MTDLNERFRRIARAYDKSQGGPIADQQMRRQLHGLYKQATEGDAHGPQPGFFNFEEQLKYRVWKECRGMEQREAKTKFVELARKLGYRDPGDSPVSWISTETWRREESWPNPDYDEAFSCINEPEILVVTDEHRDRAPTVATSERAELPPEGDETEQRRRLEDSPDTLAFHLYVPKWPVCCRRLTVLVGYRGVDDEIRPTIPETYRVDEEIETGWKTNLDFSDSDKYGEETLRDGLLAFHCHDCGSVYLSSHEV